jgi:hypothetical protein
LAHVMFTSFHGAFTQITYFNFAHSLRVAPFKDFYSSPK